MSFVTVAKCGWLGTLPVAPVLAQVTAARGPQLHRRDQGAAAKNTIAAPDHAKTSYTGRCLTATM
ncbi:MAG: hypothetical protein ACOYM1_11485 [Methylovulum sp.]